MKYLFVLVLVLAGCGSGVLPSDYTNIDVVCTMAESDNGLSFERTCLETSTSVYTLAVEVLDLIVSHQTTSAEAIAVNGFASYRQWQDGKGLLPVKVISISPEFPGLKPGDLVILKTVDLKAMALPGGVYTSFRCNQDLEVVSPNYNGQTLTKDRITYELDDCRMFSPEYLLSVEELK